MSPSTVSDLNKKIYGTIEAWRNRPIESEHPYIYVDGSLLKRSRAGEVRNVSLLVAIGARKLLRTRRPAAHWVLPLLFCATHKRMDRPVVIHTRLIAAAF